MGRLFLLGIEPRIFLYHFYQKKGLDRFIGHFAPLDIFLRKGKIEREIENGCVPVTISLMIPANYYILLFALVASAMPGCGQGISAGSANSPAADSYAAKSPPQITDASTAVSDTLQNTNIPQNAPAPSAPLPLPKRLVIDADPPVVPPKGLTAVGSARLWYRPAKC